MDPKELVLSACDLARSKGASFADCRFVEMEDESLAVFGMTPEGISRFTNRGYGVRILAEEAWGYAATPEADKDNIKETVAKALTIARASATMSRDEVRLAPLVKVVGKFTTPIEQDPFQVPLPVKVAFLAYLNELIQKVKGVTRAAANCEFHRTRTWFASTEGSKFEQTVYQTGAGIEAVAMTSRRGMGKRSFPQAGGQFETRGYELLSLLNLEKECQRIGEEAVALTTAKDGFPDITTLILDGPAVSLIIHESIGHPLELDRVFGAERNFSGISFATTDKLGKLKYASDLVTVTADAMSPFGLGTFGYDDEGVPAQRTELIKNGLLVGYLTSRELATKIGRQSTGAMRAQGWQNLPLIRMTNTNLLPGNSSLEKLITETDHGILMLGTSSWSIDDRRESFQMGCEIGYEIHGGKRGAMVKNPTYSGNTVGFWNTLDGIAGEKEWRVWGTPSCGKGQPGQNMRTGQGAAPCRFRNVKVGGA
jgi:TldD protein